MAEKNNLGKPSLLSTSISTTTQKAKNDEEEEVDPETIRRSKRRKKCPTALDKIEEFTPSSPNSSFTFDTQFTGIAAAEITPKFGSFNPVVLSTQEKEQSLCFQGLRDREAAAAAQDGDDDDDDDDKQVCVDEEKESVNFSTLRHLDVIKEIE